MRIKQLNLAITTFCSMSCPDCALDIPQRRSKQHYPLEYFEHAAQFLRGAFSVITLTGGEPTLHPDFPQLAVKIRELFQPEALHVESNGYGFAKFPEVLKTFDQVVGTIYQADSYPGCPDNGDKLRAYSGSNLITRKTVFAPRSLRPGKNSCGRLGLLVYSGGLLFPCCVGPGLPTGIGIPLAANWREAIVGVKAPCAECFFATL